MNTRCLIILFTAVAVGCGSESSATLHGTVTINNQPLKKGSVSLTPQAGDGGTAGATIVDGKFTIPGLKPGKYDVLITAEPDGPVILPNSPEANKTYTPAEIARMANPLPADTVGTTTVIEIKPGEQALEFPLTSARGR